MWTSGNHHEPCGAYNKRAASARPPAPDQDPLYPPDPCLKGVLPSQVRETREDPGNNENTTHETRELRENRMGRPGARVVLPTVSFFRLVRVFRGLFFLFPVLAAVMPLQKFRGRIRHFNCDGTPDSWEFLWCVPSAPKNPCPVGGVSLSLWRWRLFPDREIRGKEQAAPCLHPPFAPLLFCAIRPRRRIGRS